MKSPKQFDFTVPPVSIVEENTDEEIIIRDKAHIWGSPLVINTSCAFARLPQELPRRAARDTRGDGKPLRPERTQMDSNTVEQSRANLRVDHYDDPTIIEIAMDRLLHRMLVEEQTEAQNEDPHNHRAAG